MQKHAERQKNNPSKVFGNSATQKGSATKQSLQIADNRPAAIAQLKDYSKKVTIKEKITPADLNNWNEVRRKLGNIENGGAAGDIGGRVNQSLDALGIKNGDAMSAHQIPNRIGGTGGNSENVRPWDSAFEAGTWENEVEKKFDQALLSAEKDDEVQYNVTTTDMSESKAQDIIKKSTNEEEKAKSHHKERIQKIPLDVTATVGGETLGTTDECFKKLIK